MNYDIHVTRHSFYRMPGKTYRFTEHAPADVPHKHYFECGCTEGVQHKPVGKPKTVTQEISYVEDHGRYHVELELGDSGKARGFWISWPWPDDVPKDDHHHERTRGHAYFWFGNGVKIEIVGRNMPRVSILENTFLETLYYGSEVDTSRMSGGHSPSRVVKPDELRGRLWLHRDSFGGEAVAVLEPGEEYISWRAFKHNVNKAFETTSRVSGEMTVEEVRKQVLSQPMDHARQATDWALYVIDNLEQTSLFKAATQIYGQLGV